MESNYYSKYLKYKKKYLKLKGGSTVQRTNGLWTKKKEITYTLHTAQKLHEALSTFETSSLVKHFTSGESLDNFISVETRNGIILINIEDRIDGIMLKYFFYDCYPVIKNYLEFYKKIIIEGRKFKSERIRKEISSIFNFKDIFIINLYFNTASSLDVSSDIESEMNEIKILKSKKNKDLPISPYSLILTILSKLISDNMNVIKDLKDEIKNWFNMKKINLENTILINVHGSDTGEPYRLKNNIIFNSTDGSYCYQDIFLKPSLLNFYESLNTIFVGEDLDTNITKNFKNPNLENPSFNKLFEIHYTEKTWNVNNFIYEPKGKIINNLRLSISRDNYDLLICRDGKFIDYSEIFLEKTGLNYGMKIKLSDLLELNIDGSKFFENKKIIFITCRGSYRVENSNERLLQTLKRDTEQEKFTKEAVLKIPSVERRIWRNGNPKNSLLDGITSSKNKFKKKLDGLREYLTLDLEDTNCLIMSINKEINKLTYNLNGTKYFYLNSYTQDYINHILHILQTYETNALLSTGGENKIYEYVNKGINPSAIELKENIALLINNL